MNLQGFLMEIITLREIRFLVMRIRKDENSSFFSENSRKKEKNHGCGSDSREKKIMGVDFKYNEI